MPFCGEMGGRVQKKGARSQSGSPLTIQEDLTASEPPAAVPVLLTVLKSTTLRPLGGMNVSRLPELSQRIRTMRPSGRVPVPKMVPPSVANVAALETALLVASGRSIPPPQLVACILPYFSPEAPTITFPS